MGLYMKIDDVTGDVTEANHRGWIELREASWGMLRNIRSAVGVGKNRESSSAIFEEFLFQKLIDSSSHKLLSLSLTGQGKTVQIDATRVYQGGETLIRSIKLENAILDSFYNKARKQDRPREVGLFNFTKITISDFGEDASGKSRMPSRVIYDLAQAKML